MKTLADFRRAATVGSVWRVDNKLHPHVSGQRTITKAQRDGFKYVGVKADGSTLDGWCKFPLAAAMRVDGDSAHFLMAPGSDEIAFTWTLQQAAGDAHAA